MAVAGGVALLAITAGLLLPPAPEPVARTALPRPLPLPTPAGFAARPAVRPADVPAPSPVTSAATAQPLPRPDTDPTAALAQEVPRPVPLARAQRDPAAMARLEGATPPPAAALQAETGPPPTPPAPHGEPARARVGEVDLGLRLMPGSRPLPDSGRRVPDGAGGEAVALSLAATGTLDAAVQFYRQQWLADGTAADAVQVLRPGDGQALLRAQSPQGGERTVWIVQNGASLEIVLARVRPGPAAPR